MKRVFVDANIGSWGQILFDFLSSEKNQTESVPTIFYLVMTITILTC